jgi:hypothetical protein
MALPVRLCEHQLSDQRRPLAPPGVHILADFVFGDDESLSGIFMFEKAGILSGLEVYGLAADAPTSLPAPESLRPLAEAMPRGE